jgi:GT2 family glycosyltransferase
MTSSVVTLTFRPIKVIDVELSQPISTISGLASYETLQVLVRLHGTPLGYLMLPLPNQCCTATELSTAILEKYGWAILKQLTKLGLPRLAEARRFFLDELRELPTPRYSGPLPLVTVVVCTRDRPDDLKRCLDSIQNIDYPNLEILIVDNASNNDQTELLVREHFPSVRYVYEPRPGLSWARNRAIIEASGEIIAYTDDDVIVDAGWITSAVKVFTTDKTVMAVTGLVVPYELEEESQILFERHGGFGRGFEQKRYKVSGDRVPWYLLGGGRYGTGANMLYRRDLFNRIGGFNVALGAGTLSTGCEDHEMYFRVLKAGFTIVYEPSVLVRHRHRRSYKALRSQLASDGIGLYAYFRWAVTNCPAERWGFLWVALWWLWYGNVRRLWISLKYPNRFPRDLIWAELQGCFIGWGRYPKAAKEAAKLAGDPTIAHRPHTLLETRKTDTQKETRFVESTTDAPAVTATQVKNPVAIAIRTVEISNPLQPLIDITDYQTVRVFVTYQRQLLGQLDIHNGGQPVMASQLYDLIAEELTEKLWELNLGLTKELRWAKAMSTVMTDWIVRVEPQASIDSFTETCSVSVIVATYDRPDSLRLCLCSLLAQKIDRSVEIIVVDNHPNSGQTLPIVKELSQVTLVNEPRQGVSYARNSGIARSTGNIIVTVDDDVIVPTNWLETLISPFARPDVMVVTGNILPLELKTSSQQLFELYGGLGRGIEPFEVNGDWFENFPRKAVPTWTLGGTANAAFRSSIFHHPQIGLMDEALGPGMPSGVGEDTYLFYKVLKAGYTLVYQPKAYVWHQHRRTMAALRRQIYNYSKGHVAYNLTTWLQDGDWRGLVQILVGLPLAHLSRTYDRLRGWSEYPISLILLEILGNLAGPWSLWMSHLRVRREGRSQAYTPPNQRYSSAIGADVDCNVVVNTGGDR